MTEPGLDLDENEFDITLWGGVFEAEDLSKLVQRWADAQQQGTKIVSSYRRTACQPTPLLKTWLDEQSLSQRVLVELRSRLIRVDNHLSYHWHHVISFANDADATLFKIAFFDHLK